MTIIHVAIVAKLRNFGSLKRCSSFLSLNEMTVTAMSKTLGKSMTITVPAVNTTLHSKNISVSPLELLFIMTTGSYVSQTTVANV